MDMMLAEIMDFRDPTEEDKAKIEYIMNPFKKKIKKEIFELTLMYLIFYPVLIVFLIKFLSTGDAYRTAVTVIFLIIVTLIFLVSVLLIRKMHNCLTRCNSGKFEVLDCTICELINKRSADKGSNYSDIRIRTAMGTRCRDLLNIEANLIKEETKELNIKAITVKIDDGFTNQYIVIPIR